MPEATTTATIVFTDMVGSTALRARLGEEQADELRRIHDRLLVARVEANGGRVLKGQGDGVMAAFPSASAGVQAAVEMQQAVASYSRRLDALAQISIRIGLSVGDVSWEGGDGFGTTVIEAARLEAAAGGGQILCSDLVRMMARGRGGHHFGAAVLLELKGLPEPVAACEVMWEPAADVPPLPLPPELAAGPARPFVSRSAELDAVDGVLSDPARERLGVVWLLGEPGIGKTRLATEIAGRAHAAGGVVLFGRCSEDLSIPYQPFVEALRWYVAHVTDHELADRLGATPGELSRLAPEIGKRLPATGVERSTSPEVELHRLFEAVRTWLAAAGAGRPLVLVVDDVHWAARPTLTMLGHVARSAEASRAVLVCTARNTSPDDNETLAALVEELGRRGGPSHRLEIGGLGEDAVGVLVAHSTGRALDGPSRRLAARLHDETAGNPLFLDALLDSLPAGQLLRGDPGALPAELPRTLSETVLRRASRLSPEVTGFLHTASVIGLDFDLRLLARAGGHTELAALEALEAAGRAGLVEETGADRYRFSHGLVRAALRDGLSRSRRIRIHLQVGEALESLFAARLDEHADALAHHFLEAAPAAGAARAYAYRVMAAERASRLLSHDDAADGYGQALELLPDVDGLDPLARFDLLFARGEALLAAGDLSAALVTYRSAAEEATARGEAERLARAAVRFEEANLWAGHPAHEALALLQQAEAAAPADPTLSVLLMASLSRALLYTGQVTESRRRGAEALALAEGLGDPVTATTVLSRTTVPWVNVAEAATQAQGWNQVLNQARTVGDDDTAIMATWMLLWAQTQLGDLAAVERLHADYARLAELRRPLWNFFLTPYQSLRAFLAGDLAGAESLLEGAGDVKETGGWIGGWVSEGLYAVAMFLIRREQGRLSEIAPAIRAMARLGVGAADVWRPGLAALYAELGMAQEARAEFEAFTGDDLAAVPNDSSRELCLALLAEVCAHLGDDRRAPVLLDELLPCAGRLLVFLGSAVCLGPTDRLLAMLASVAGRHEQAERWHRAGLDLATRLDSPLWRAHCLYDHARHRLRTGGPGAGDMLAEAARLCHDHHLSGLAHKVAQKVAQT